LQYQKAPLFQRGFFIEKNYCHGIHGRTQKNKGTTRNVFVFFRGFRGNYKKLLINMKKH